MARRQLQNLGISILKHKQTPSISCESKLGLKFYSSKASDLQIADGTPKVREGRKCVIFARSKTAMSSGNSQTLEGTWLYRVSLIFGPTENPKSLDSFLISALFFKKKKRRLSDKILGVGYHVSCLIVMY